MIKNTIALIVEDDPNQAEFFTTVLQLLCKTTTLSEKSPIFAPA